VTLKRLYARIAHWDVAFFCTDDVAPYSKILPKDKVVMSNALTIGIEQNNGRQRHWFKRFGRQSIVVSKSREMVDLTLFLFAAYHVNKTLTLPSLFA
jgi:insertion element IS1 protein InsB